MHRLLRSFRHVVFGLALASLSQTASAQVNHPMDPLSWQEYWTVLEVLNAEGHVNDETRFSQVLLQEPTKDIGWGWQHGDAIPRAAFAVVKQGASTFEAVVDVKNSRLVAWTEVRGVQPNWLNEEFFSMTSVVKEHPEFVEALERRGYTDLTFIECVTLPPAYFDKPEWRNRRVGQVNCEDSRGIRNTWTRQIEGLTAIVDMNAREVLEVVDEGVVPVPTGNADFDDASVGPLRKHAAPIRVEQPLGPGFKLAGHEVAWDRWSFHVRPNQRTGAVISLVRYHDGDRVRPILYQGSLSEIFVPYMDPATPWYARTFLDAGEYSAGGLAKPMEPGIDCPENARYLDFVVAGDNGRPSTVERTVCIFERYAGDAAWRHRDESAKGRPKRDLVVRFAAVLGNYDYYFDWTFQQDGTIRVGVGSTGITEVKMVTDRVAMAAGTNGDHGTNGGYSEAERADAFGRFVQENVVAVNHDHYFNFRLDLDVDGPTNRFQRDRLVQRRLPADHVRRSIWVVESETARSESHAKLNVDLKRPAMWRVVNPTATNHVGYPVSYQLLTSGAIETLLSADDYPRRRAGFIDHHLWVTPYSTAERYAAGKYPTLSAPGQGLPEWTNADRGIADTDIVLWHTIGMHHVVRAEDWPVMPVMWKTFELRPFDFFDGNPALDLPKTP